MAVVDVRRALLIVNPAARRGAAALDGVARVFARAGVQCTIQQTAHRGHAEAIARAQAHAHDAVFTLGGDGTVMEVLRALLGDATPVGVIPGGTGNLVARALGIPMSPARAALDGVLALSSRRRGRRWRSIRSPCARPWTACRIPFGRRRPWSPTSGRFSAASSSWGRGFPRMTECSTCASFPRRASATRFAWDGASCATISAPIQPCTSSAAAPCISRPIRPAIRRRTANCSRRDRCT
ncbi:MAG: acylglycerol kinase family protein [Gemmatimonadetes bacterium]|nr:acylglycerol kinase family protein [Gemmatimonadota bacterium]